MQRKASAEWKGGLKDGKGTVSSASGILSNTPYSFTTRFENAPGTNPEELIAAAHASCFSMALAAQLGERGITPDSIETTSDITFEDKTLAKSALTTNVTAHGADKSKIEEAAAAAKQGVPISKVLKLEITLKLDIVT